MHMKYLGKISKIFIIVIYISVIQNQKCQEFYIMNIVTLTYRIAYQIPNKN